MIYTKANPVGIDDPIQRKQWEIFGTLVPLWGITEEDYKSYGRCYCNQTPEGFLPEMYVGKKKKEYESLFLDDKVAVTSFFGYNRSVIPESGVFGASVHLIFAVDLNKVYPNIKWRADEEVRTDVINLMKDDKGFELTEVLVNIDKVFSEYTAWRHPDKGINYRDMQNFHFFRLNFVVRYDPNSNICF